MAVRKILTIRDRDAEKLSKAAQPIRTLPSNFDRLVADLWETMYANNGVGLAAPQVGVLRAVCVIDATHLYFPGNPNHILKFLLINPEYAEVGDAYDYAAETCLSIPDFEVVVPRWQRITVAYNEPTRLGLTERRTIEVFGPLARVMQHEIDHLHGVLTLDRVRYGMPQRNGKKWADL